MINVCLAKIFKGLNTVSFARNIQPHWRKKQVFPEISIYGELLVTTGTVLSFHFYDYLFAGFNIPTLQRLLIFSLWLIFVEFYLEKPRIQQNFSKVAALYMLAKRINRTSGPSLTSRDTCTTVLGSTHSLNTARRAQQWSRRPPLMCDRFTATSANWSIRSKATELRIEELRCQSTRLWLLW